MGKVSVDNFDEVKLHLRKELGLLAQKIERTMKENQSSNFLSNADLIRLENLLRLISQIIATHEDVLNRVELNPTINVTTPDVNIPEIKIPEINIPEFHIPAPVVNVEAPNVTVTPASVRIDIESIIEALKPLEHLSNRPDSPISVRLSDGKKFLESMKALVDNQDKMVQVFSSNQSMTVDEFKTVGGRAATDYIWNESAKLTPKFAVIDAATNGDNTIVAAVSGKKIRVLSLFLMSAGTVNTRFESGAGGTALTGQINLVAQTGYVLPHNPYGWFETAAGSLLNLELNAAVSVDGSLSYIEV